MESPKCDETLFRAVPQRSPRDPKLPTCMPIAGKSQKLHELEIENAEAHFKERRSDGLHKIVKKKLKLK